MLNYTYYPDLRNKKYGFTSPICTHPNEHGYEFFACRLFEIIKTFFPHYINNVSLEGGENIYWGDVKIYYYLNNEVFNK